MNYVSTFLFLFFILCRKCHSSEDEYRLILDLKDNYNPVERPVKNHTEALPVNLRIILQQLVDVDEKNQVVTLVVWTQMTWNDYKMRWDPDEYGGIKNIQLPPGTLWKPDILLFNSQIPSLTHPVVGKLCSFCADEHFDALFPVNFVVQYTGDILLAPPSIVRISCHMDLTHFPFDDQICYLKYGSWTFTGSKVDLGIDMSGMEEGQNQMDLLYYIPNGEWDLLSTPAKRVAKEFIGETYIELYFHMHIKRRTLYYGLNWIIPSLLISLTNVLGFTLPAECGEKVTVQITNLLSVLVFLGMVTQVTPPSSESIPVIVAFFSASLVILGLSVLATILIINIHFRNPKTHQMSPWLTFAFLEWLPWFLLMKRPGKVFSRPKRSDLDDGKEEADQRRINLDCTCAKAEQCTQLCDPLIRKMKQILHKEVEVKISEDERRAAIASPEPLLSQTDPASPKIRPRLLVNDVPTEFSAIEGYVEKIIEDLKFLKEKVEEEDEEEDQRADWKFMALVLDRLFLFIFTGIYIFVSFVMVTATPRLFDTSPVDFNVTRDYNL